MACHLFLKVPSYLIEYYIIVNLTLVGAII